MMPAYCCPELHFMGHEKTKIVIRSGHCVLKAKPSLHCWLFLKHDDVTQRTVHVFLHMGQKRDPQRDFKKLQVSPWFSQCPLLHMVQLHQTKERRHNALSCPLNMRR